MNFFWLVRDEGSWLDIGTSISHFVIASLLCVFVAGLEFVSEIFVSGVDIGTELQPVGNGSVKKVEIGKNHQHGSVLSNSNGAAEGD